MNSFIFCEKDPKHYEKINFFLEHDGVKYYLFTQHYSNTAYYRFKDKMRLENAMKHQSGFQLKSFNEKLPKYIKFIEDYEHITILQKSFKKKQNGKNFKEAA